ncbi:hypothetical protein IHE44_0013836, partial [Lamprotornis superbus]
TQNVVIHDKILQLCETELCTPTLIILNHLLDLVQDIHEQGKLDAALQQQSAVYLEKKEGMDIARVVCMQKNLHDMQRGTILYTHLQDKLAEKDKELKTMKLDLELQDRATEAKIAEKIAALVEEVYSAQRERDEAVMARLRLANEERDEAFLRVQRLEKSLKELENINPEENDMELLNRINNADTGIDILKNGAIILNRIHRTKERKKKIIAEEMNAVIEQRDAALSQCKRLEQELHHLKEQNQTSANNTRHMTAENNQERALKEKKSHCLAEMCLCFKKMTSYFFSLAELIALQQEKEAALQQCKKLEEEIQTLRVYYRLYKSLSEGMSLKNQPNCAFSGLQGREDAVTLTYGQIEELAAQLQQTRSEQKDTELKLQKALEASQEANEKVQKLERLVDVLRKKVGAGTIRTVI